MVPYFAPKPLRGGASKGWKVKMCECGPPLLSLGRLAELWRVIRMCEGGPPTSRLPQLRDALTRGCVIFDYCRLGLGSVRTIRAGFPAAIE